MAHHRDAVRLDGDRLAQLLDHLLGVPAGKDVVDPWPEVMLGLLGAVVHDRAESVALGAADKEAQVHALAPLVARIGARRRCRGGERRSARRGQQHGGERESRRAFPSDCHCVDHNIILPFAPRGASPRYSRLRRRRAPVRLRYLRPRQARSAPRRGTPSSTRAPGPGRSFRGRLDRPGHASLRRRSIP